MLKDQDIREQKGDKVSEEQQEQPEQPEKAEQVEPQVEKLEGSEQPAARTPAKKKRAKKKLPSEEELAPRPSYWPLALACSIAVTLAGLMTHPIILGLGVALIIASIIGWGVERR
ncbi:hypothetical protein EPA93_36620 [Ktedonosporobacter rubrisoli]|uniref:Cytochrome aa3 subunit 4 n=1 Tax=Ktedonosporobacter rubrisoli TaxID=2509675 RepID=A0A4P6K195_KTERU|nr:hypothetical protein [Ktedonosporobacter rubrisoli]QBD81206.1 hypothetical protein EPA93_36620 [Ktedonosporobacter rubrisoli]